MRAFPVSNASLSNLKSCRSAVGGVSLKTSAPFTVQPRLHPRLAKPLSVSLKTSAPFTVQPRLHPRLATPLSASLRPGESADQALERRLRESERVEQRVYYITSINEWEQELSKAEDRLVVLELHSDTVCQTGDEEEAELQWKEDQEAALEPCRQLKHTFQRIARDCPDVVFLAADADSDQGHELCDALEVDVLPTVQFWRHGKLLWQHRGVLEMEQDLGEGVLYFGDTAANNEKASSYIQDLHSRADYDNFIASAAPDELVVVDISLTDAAPCVHIFPAVLALARSFQGGYAAFARLMGDENEELKQLMLELNVIQVPTFVFYRGGKLVGRHVGSSRGDLIGQILTQQSAAGIQPPAPQGRAVRRPAAAKARA
jgi:thioredoxin-like negative regulator of GroEL